MEFKTKQFELKSVSDTGVVTGYFSTYDVIADSYGDIVAPHAFDATIKAREESGKPFPLVWNHNMGDPEMIIGQVDKIENDEHGPLMSAHFYDTPKAQAARNLLREGSVYQFSFAYNTLSERNPTAAEKAKDSRIVNVLEELELLEVTITPVPANPRAEVVSVKSGRRNSKADEDKLKEAISLIQEVLGQLDEDMPEPEGEDEPEDNAAAEDQKASNPEEKAAILDYINSMRK